MQRPLLLPVLLCTTALLLTACGGDAAAKDTHSPSAPRGVTAQASSATSVHVMWEPATDDTGVSAYEVFRAGTKVKSVPAPKHMIDVDGLAPSSPYTFTVRALDAAGNASPHSASIPVTTLVPTVEDRRPPSTPGAPKGSVEGTRAVTLTWGRSTDDEAVTSYDIYQADSRIHTAPGTTTTARITGLRPGTVYTFTVRARDAADNSSPDSAPLDLTTAPAEGAGPSTAPTSLTATARADGAAHTIDLAWTPPKTGAPVKEHQLYLNGAFATTIVWGTEPPPGRATYSFTVTDKPGTRYSVKLRAKLPDGNWGDFSAQRTVVIG
ncbi:fibronectin type III domain-containing protein [Streptomyces sp. FIT100]|uniref:fibronectin type III domain-containing protein n=1 Tax=Streptomyces sp. FIT100 TaxID=2837956 RepID=UPI0021C656CF|nr:fibronectin type III domain-containing protein [Streptomyces sp. FIT100]UUN30116.1 fibronectin type III domain-containing protein [Streptomyces sp. FIT100]